MTIGVSSLVTTWTLTTATQDLTPSTIWFPGQVVVDLFGAGQLRDRRGHQHHGPGPGVGHWCRDVSDLRRRDLLRDTSPVWRGSVSNHQWTVRAVARDEQWRLRDLGHHDVDHRARGSDLDGDDLHANHRWAGRGVVHAGPEQRDAAAPSERTGDL